MQAKYYYIVEDPIGDFSIHTKSCNMSCPLIPKRFIGTFYSAQGALTHTRSMGYNCHLCTLCCRLTDEK